MKIYYLIFISRTSCTLLVFHVASLNMNNCLIMPGKGYVQILQHLHRQEMPSSVKWASTTLQDCVDSSDELRSGNIYSMIHFKLGLWVGQSFNTVKPSSVGLCCVAWNLWHGAPSFWKISLSQRSNIKWSFSNWTYLVLFKLLSILINFLKLSLYVSTKHQTLFMFFYHVTWVITLSCRTMTKFCIFEYSFILISLLNMILF